MVLSGERKGVPDYNALEMAADILENSEPFTIYLNQEIAVDPFNRHRPIIQQAIVNLRKMHDAGATPGWNRFYLNETIIRLPQISALNTK